MSHQHPQLPDHELATVVVELVVGTRNEMLRRRENMGYDELKEWDQQIQLAVSGIAGATAVYATPVALTFDVAFATSTNSRDSNLVAPHFTYGFELVTGTPVAFTAMVSKWVQDTNGTFTGCEVTMGAWAPDLPVAGAVYSGFAHLNFQGYGSPPEVDQSVLADTLGAG